MVFVYGSYTADICKVIDKVIQMIKEKLTSGESSI